MDHREPIACMTMVRGDYDMLLLWIRHHRKQVTAPEHLYIVSHGHDPKISEIAKGCSIVTIPFDETGNQFNVKRIFLLRNMAAGLLGYFRNVFFCDVDEFLVANPATGAPVAELVTTERPEAPVLSPLGFNVIQHPTKEASPIDLTKPILAQRRHVILDPHYSKPSIFRRPHYQGTAHRVRGVAWTLTPKLYLFHLKWFDQAHVAQLHQDRSETLQDYLDKGGAPGIGAWDRISDGFLSVQTKLTAAPEPLEDQDFSWVENRFQRMLKRRGNTNGQQFGPFFVGKDLGGEI